VRLLLIGCEYTEKQTLAVRISQWMIRTMGVPYVRWHDHFVVPRLDGHMIVRGTDEAPVPGKDDAYLNTADDEAQILTLRPGVLEQLQRHMIWRHLHPDMYRDNDVLSINHYYADTVYAPSTTATASRAASRTAYKGPESGTWSYWIWRQTLCWCTWRLRTDSSQAHGRVPSKEGAVASGGRASGIAALP